MVVHKLKDDPVGCEKPYPHASYTNPNSETGPVERHTGHGTGQS